MKNSYKNMMLASVLSGLVVSTAATAIDYSSPYMNAKDTEFVNINDEFGHGAKVTKETQKYWQYGATDSQRVSFDRPTVINVDKGIWTIGTHSIVNMNVIDAPEGLVLYDTGDNEQDGQEFYELLRKETDRPVAAIIYSHEHYTLGAKYIVEQEAKRGNTGIKIIGHPNTNNSMATTGGVMSAQPEVGGVTMARSMEQFNGYLPKEGDTAGFKNTIIPSPGGYVAVNVMPEDGETLNVAGLDMVFYSKDVGTDTNSQLLVYVPSKGAVLNNVIWGWFPNIYSARGGRYRDPNQWVNTIKKIESLEPEIILSSHSTPLKGKDKIKERLVDYRDGLSFMLDQTLKGIALGQGPDELRYSVKLPEYLEKAPILIQNYGETSIMPPRIFTAIFGQYDRNAAHMNKLYPKDEAARMVEAMGGEAELVGKVKQAYDNGDYLWAAQLADYLVLNNPSQENKNLKGDALEQMGYRAFSTNSRSIYLTQAAELKGTAKVIKNVPATPSMVADNVGDYVNYYRIRINPERSANTEKLISFDFGDEKQYGLRIRQAVVDFVDTEELKSENADVTMKMEPMVWSNIYNNLATFEQLIQDGKITVSQGNSDEAIKLMSLFDVIYDWQNDEALKALASQMQ
ncbi:MAG: alkyl sulfatase dimerization domain-containing protein [Alphaproteobacteria bacterium]